MATLSSIPDPTVDTLLDISEGFPKGIFGPDVSPVLGDRVAWNVTGRPGV